MKKIVLILLAISFGLIVIFKTESYAYTVSNPGVTYYNQTTDTIGQADLLDISSNSIEYMYFNLGENVMLNTTTIRIVFSNVITTQPLSRLNNVGNHIPIEINFYSSTNQLLLQNISYYNSLLSLSYFETNFVNVNYIDTLDYITIKISGLNAFDETNASQNLLGAIIVGGSGMIINQPIGTTQYANGWSDAMNSKVTQIWSLWGNIFDTFMSVFNVFSVKLMGDITIGHIALVPLVLGLIGFIYALGGKRGR